MQIVYGRQQALTIYDFYHSCIVMFPPIDVPCLLGPPDRGTQKKGEKPKNNQQKNNISELFLQKPQVQRPLDIFFFGVLFGFLETQDSQTSGKYPITNFFCISSSAFSFLKTYTLLKSLALVILHHNRVV